MIAVGDGQQAALDAVGQVPHNAWPAGEGSKVEHELLRCAAVSRRYVIVDG